MDCKECVKRCKDFHGAAQNYYKEARGADHQDPKTEHEEQLERRPMEKIYQLCRLPEIMVVLGCNKLARMKLESPREDKCDKM